MATESAHLDFDCLKDLSKAQDHLSPAKIAETVLYGAGITTSGQCCHGEQGNEVWCTYFVMTEMMNGLSKPAFWKYWVP